MSKLTHSWHARLVGLTALLVSPIAMAPFGAQTDALYEVTETKDVMVAMRDGVRLATNVYRPARNGAPAGGRFPVLLQRTPYNKDAVGGDVLPTSDPVVRARLEAARAAKYFVPRGY